MKKFMILIIAFVAVTALHAQKTKPASSEHLTNEEAQKIFPGLKKEFDTRFVEYNRRIEEYVTLEKAQKGAATPDSAALCRSLSALNQASTSLGAAIEKISQMVDALKSTKVKGMAEDMTELTLFVADDEKGDLKRILDFYENTFLRTRAVFGKRMVKYGCK